MIFKLAEVILALAVLFIAFKYLTKLFFIFMNPVKDKIDYNKYKEAQKKKREELDYDKIARKTEELARRIEEYEKQKNK